MVLTKSKILGTCYHRADALGGGSFGSVVVVYNDEGAEFAQKTFEEDEDDEDYNGSLDVGVFRELSTLRLLMAPNCTHPNVLVIHDVTYVDDALNLIMPKFMMDLSSAIKKSTVPKGPPRVKVAHGLLSALTFLHDNSIIHRDVKTENVMLDSSGNPVLIDFSLAKILTDGEMLTDDTHTGNVGSACYIAPECYRNEEYGVKCDAYSAGVIILELFNGERLSTERDKAAFKEVQQTVCAMDASKPLPSVLRRLVEEDKDGRAHCREVLDMPLFKKNNLPVPPIRKVLDEAFISVGDAGKVTDLFATESKLKSSLQKMCQCAETTSDLTPLAAKAYKNASPNTPLQYCVLLASKLYDREPISFDDSSDAIIEKLNLECDIDEYVAAELEILERMNYCVFIPPVSDEVDTKGRKKKRQKR